MFELTVPPLVVATTISPATSVNEGPVIVNVARPEASVVAVPLLPKSGPLNVKVTIVPTTGSPFDRTSAVLVMTEALEPHMIEEL